VLPKILLMQSYYYFLLIIGLSLILLVRFFILRKRNIPAEMFLEALRNENSGNFEEAVITYENALNEVKKIRFHDSSLKRRITEKLKVLRTIIDYEHSQHVVR
jgi:hypothetical protein